MISITAVGYVTGSPKSFSTKYGPGYEIVIRCKPVSRDKLVYVNARFYGNKGKAIERYIKDGQQVTIAGLVTLMEEKRKKDSTGYYTQVYVNGYEYSLPPSPRSLASMVDSEAADPYEEEHQH